MFPATHKSVFVLDRSPCFSKSSKQSIEYDVITKGKTPGVIPAAPISKTLWTCSVEAMLEYMRIVYDIFPEDKLIRVVTGAHSLNSWIQKEQNVQQMMLALAHIGPPSGDDEYNVITGLSHAIEALCEPSDKQCEHQASFDEEEDLQNEGRIICITSLKSEAHIRMLEECVCDALNQHNKLAAATESTIPVSHCELVFVHTTPVGEESKIAVRSRKEISPYLSSEVHVTESARYQYYKLVHLVQENYDLGSTTVTGIPMKEEQNASSSANYDVELLHPRSAHQDLVSVATAEGLVIPSKEGLPTLTITLKWCTPKSNVVELHHCTHAYRITPVDVNSRPSSCLTNFLLAGRAVMLEMPKKTGSKVISHMLASHGGEIFIHTMSITRSILEDPPSISEGSGGRVTDYRIPDFGEFMKENRLAPAISPQEADELPITRANSHMERMTRYWPIVISETIVFNMASHIDPLPSLIVKETLDEDDVLECKKAIYHVVGMESRNEALPITTVGSRGKGPKREEQYRQMWSELESLIRAYSETSSQHQEILDCLLDCKKPSEDSKTSPKKSVSKEEKTDTTDIEQTWKELEKYQKMTEREKLDFNKGDKPFESPPKRLKIAGSEEGFTKISGSQNLLSIWTNRIQSIHSKRHQEFSGRVESEGPVAELYKHMNENEEGENTDGTAAPVSGITRPERTSTPTTKPVPSANNKNGVSKSSAVSILKR